MGIEGGNEGLIRAAAARAAAEVSETRGGTPERAALTEARAVLERLAELPTRPAEQPDPRTCAAALSERIVALERPLRRVLEHILLSAAAGAHPLPALHLTGPSGAGKRALVHAVAAASGRPLARIGPHELGGAGLAGRARGEGGARPGLVVEALIAAGTFAPVLWLEGIDAREDDPAADAVLDPARRASFEDRYLGVPVDLSRALVVVTSRHPSRVPEALRRHLHEVRLPGYSRDEKLLVLRRALIPRAQAALGPQGRELEATDAALERLVTAYAPEPGVLALARRAEELLRRAAARLLMGEAATGRIDAGDVERLLGPPPVDPGPRRRAEVGVALGLAWGADGAEVALVEAIREGGGGAPSLRPGGAWRAATETALAYVGSRADRLRVDPGCLGDGSFRLRVSGPAPLGDDDGIDLAVLLALVSLATDRPVRPDVSLAGALTLRGAVRPTAGLPEKVLAAARGGARKVLVPAGDFAALESSLAPQALAAIEVVPVAHADDAVREALIDIVIAREVR